MIVTMLFVGSSLILTVSLFLLAIVFGVLLTLIALEIKGSFRYKARPGRLAKSPLKIHTEAESHRRQALMVQLMGLYSGVHSADALSDFLNRELERRHETWRVHIPIDGPGEIYDLDRA